MNKSKMTRFILAAVLPAVSALSQEKPNIGLILADDFGYGSVNAYGG